MQILYVIAMVAVFVLCAALLSTTRRILHPSPAPSGQVNPGHGYTTLALDEAPPMAGVAEPETATAALQTTAAIQTTAAFQTMTGDRTGDPAEASQEEAAAPFNASIRESEDEPERTLIGQPIPNASAAEAVSAAMEDEPGREIDAEAAKGWMPKPSRRTYNRALECLLVGVSAWVLIRTQRIASRQRMAHSANAHVA